MRNIILGILLVVVLVYTHNIYAEERGVDMRTENVEYTLPYPGILPDHPLYIAKRVRDRIMLVFTRDTEDQALLYHHLSDKKIHMALILSEKGKWHLSSQIATEGVNHFETSLPIFKKIKKQNKQFIEEIKPKLSVSCQKQKEILSKLLRDMPQGSRENVSTAIEKNSSITKGISSL